MLDKVISTIIGFVVTGALGYCLNIIKGYKTKSHDLLVEFERLKESELSDMKSDLSSKFFIYDSLEEVEDYLVISFREKCERYFEMGGNTWIHPMYDKSFQWKIKTTGYLK